MVVLGKLSVGALADGQTCRARTLDSLGLVSHGSDNFQRGVFSIGVFTESVSRIQAANSWQSGLLDATSPQEPHTFGDEDGYDYDHILQGSPLPSRSSSNESTRAGRNQPFSKALACREPSLILLPVRQLLPHLPTFLSVPASRWSEALHLASTEHRSQRSLRCAESLDKTWWFAQLQPLLHTGNPANCKLDYWHVET